MHYVNPLEAARRGVVDLDDLARLDSPVHRLDARIKALATVAFAAAAISFPKYALSGLAPLALYPAVVVGLARLPVRPLLWRLAPAAPLILLVGAANPYFDRAVLWHIGGMNVTGGWLSFASIAARLGLTLLGGLLLAATTPVFEIALAIERLGLPRALATQIMLMYRYFFVLADEGGRILRAHWLRSGRRAIPIGLAGPMAGQFLLRAVARSERIHQAMLARGFDGAMRRAPAPAISSASWLWLFAWCCFFTAARLVPASEILGGWALGESIR